MRSNHQSRCRTSDTASFSVFPTRSPLKMAEMNMIVLSRRCRFLPGEFFTVIFPSAFALATIDESVGQTAASAATVLARVGGDRCVGGD